MNIVFLSTPEFGIPSLEKLINSRHKVLAVISQPDRPNERGNKITDSPIKDFALAHNLKVFQFEKISRDGIQVLKELSPDIMITASYGQILSQEVIDIPKYGIINIHGSLLPKYRGASPVQSAVIDGETKTGITIMQTEASLDTGDILKVVETQIDPNETAGELMKRLAEIGANALLETLDMIENQTIVPKKQSHFSASITTKITKEQGVIFWEKSADQIKCQILGQNPFPIAYSFLRGEKVNIYRARNSSVTCTEKSPGSVVEPSSPKRGLFVQCGVGVLEITEIQFPGGRIISGAQAIGGRKIAVDDVFLNEVKGENAAIVFGHNSPKSK